ncbi:MAG: hypothetical protein AB1529_02535 [Candidatus Micrarchaeota archaeon]
MRSTRHMRQPAFSIQQPVSGSELCVSARTQNQKHETGNRTFRGQVWSFDFLFSAALLFMILILYLLIWQNMEAVSKGSMEGSSLLAANLRVSDALVISPGDPANWSELGEINESTVESIGLADERNVLSARKLERMAALNSTHYEFFKEALGIPTREFQMEVVDLDDNLLYSFGNSSNESETSVLERAALLNGTEVIVVVRVWE